MYRYYTIIYENNIPIYIEGSNNKPTNTFDITKAIAELINLAPNKTK